MTVEQAVNAYRVLLCFGRISLTRCMDQTPNEWFETNVGSTYKFRARFANGTYTGDWSSFSNTITVNT